MLNPSTAGDTENDRTVNRCINFAKTWGFGSLNVANLFAFKTTYPHELFASLNPVGEENDYWINKLYNEADLTIAAWGNHGRYQDRCKYVLASLSDVYTLGLTKQNQPRHPLYVKSDTAPKKIII